MAHISHATDLFLESKPSILLTGGNIDLATKQFAQISPTWRLFIAQTLLFFGMDIQWGIPYVADPSKVAGGLVTASTCRSLIIKPEGPLCNTSLEPLHVYFFPKE